MARGTIPAGFCDNCGEQIFVGMKYCSSCGHSLDTNTRVIQSNLAPTQAVLPPTQYVFPPTQPVSPPTVLSIAPPSTLSPVSNLQNLPIDEQIDITRTSLSNPYASWGKLICDDTAKRMWKEGSSKYSEWNYAGIAFCITNPVSGSYWPGVSSWLSEGSVPLTDFAFQVHVKIQRHANHNAITAGLVFRYDTASYYSFYVLAFDQKQEAVLMANLRGTSLVLARVEITSKSPVEDEFLLAVVTQGPLIDLYVNCTHIKQVRDYHLSKGAVGLTATDVKAAIFTHAKVWT